MLKKLLAIIFLFSLIKTVSGHVASVEGKILSSYNNQSISGATVSLKGTDYVTTTDASGKFSFTEIPARNYTIVAEKKGSYTFEKEIDLKTEQTLQLSLFLYPELISLPDVTATTQRNTQAASSEIISGVDLELRPRNTAQDMLRLVPGLFIAQHAGGGKAEQIFVRGFDCDHGTDVATFVDGIPVNMPSHGHGQGYADLHFLIPETVKKMEVYKGTYNAQYGNFATGAAIQFRTFDTLERNQATVEFGSVPTNRAFSSSRVLLMANIPTGTSKISSYVAGEYAYTPGYFENNQQFHRYNLFGKVKAYVSNSTSLTFSASGFGGSWNASGQIPERAVDDGFIKRFGGIDNTEGGTTQRQNLNLQLQNFHNNRQLDMNIFFTQYRFKLFSNFTFFAEDSLNGDGIEQNDKRSVLGFNTSYGTYYMLGKVKTKTTIGLGFRTDFIENSLWNAAARKRLDATAQAKIHENAMNIWVKQDFEFAKWFHADIALRNDYFIFDVEDQLPTDSTRQNYSAYNYQLLPNYKLNLIFSPTQNLQLFVNSGMGYHSNDARSVVQNKNNHLLPPAFSNEVGAQINIADRAVISAAFWTLELKNELIYVGDDGNTEDKGSSRRYGIDFSTRVQLLKWLYFDGDVNIARSVFTDKLFGKKQTIDFYVPLSPFITSTGGLSVRHKSGFKGSVRYRVMANRPANELNSVVAKGYGLMDVIIGYERKKMEVKLTVENLLNSQWNEAQFATESRLRNEEAPIEELHFTPGTPLAIKVGFSYFF
ncbi:MAG: TonB-dependent receptor [Bacteroidota bacterium]